ncbi:hypothetical protein BT63DRAFT_456757 [Microthyrium microscopicum]|uniref:Uncharacterized protein n=1 Tax=Microthyrium microscopicum TaxID=703497 RepID=A0A6A6U798_9PEZI|nr:hypothetical protein BT63DRAFT_456757 [Microthyrium microscopicum]
MVKVLENKIIDLDLLPGQEHIEVQRQLRQQLNNARGQIENGGEQAQGAVVGAGGQAQNLAGQQGVQIPKEMLPDSMSDEQKSQARSVAGTILDGSGNVIGGLAGTVGGVLKGVGDTAGNTVYALGSGLLQTGSGAATTLAGTATAPFSGGTKEVEPAPAEDASEGAATKKKGPRKIEIRNGKPVDISETNEKEDVNEAEGEK